MSTFKLPNTQGLIRTNYKSDKYGELWETFGIDLQSEGKVKSSRKMVKVKDVNDDANFGEVVGLQTFDSNHYSVTQSGTGKEIYRCSVLSDPTVEDNWVKYNSNGNFSDETDTTVFGGLLLISSATDIFSTTGSIDTTNWWTGTVSGTTLTSSPHVLEVLRSGQETLFVTDGNLVRYYNATSGHSTVTLQTDLVANTMHRGGQSMWVGTQTETNENALVYEIYVGEQLDGTPIARNAFPVDGRAVLWLRVVDGIPYVLTDKGHIQRFNGVGFVTVPNASLPFAFTNESLDGVRAGNVSENPLNRPVHHAGADVNNQSVYFLLNAKMYNEDKVPTRCSSGIWEFNTVTQQLNHRSALVETTAQNGFHLFASSGPLMVINNPETLYLSGGQLFGKDAGLFAESNSFYGYITTIEIESGTIQDALEAQYIKAKTLTGSDNIELKYRTVSRNRQVVSGIWVNSTTFNTTDTVVVEEGDEFTLQEGTSAGKTAHVVSVSTSDTVTVINLDTAIGTADEVDTTEITNFHTFKKNDDSGARVSDTYTSTNAEYKKYGADEVNTWIQYKIVFNGEVEMREFISKGTASTGM